MRPILIPTLVMAGLISEQQLNLLAVWANAIQTKE